MPDLFESRKKASGGGGGISLYPWEYLDYDNQVVILDGTSGQGGNQYITPSPGVINCGGLADTSRAYVTFLNNGTEKLTIFFSTSTNSGMLASVPDNVLFIDEGVTLKFYGEYGNARRIVFIPFKSQNFPFKLLDVLNSVPLTANYTVPADGLLSIPFPPNGYSSSSTYQLNGVTILSRVVSVKQGDIYTGLAWDYYNKLYFIPYKS